MDNKSSLAPPASCEAPENLTLIGQAVQKLRNAIAKGTLRPGQKLIEASLCKTLDISRPSLREVLRVLEAEKLVELVPNRGPSVAKPGPEDIRNILEVLELLLLHSVAIMIRRADGRSVAVLDNAMDQITRAQREKKVEEQVLGLRIFLHELLERSDNPVLVAVAVTLLARISFSLSQALRNPAISASISSAAANMLSRIRAGKPAESVTAVRAFVASLAIIREKAGESYP